jgi:hypothetical protein
MFLGKKEDLLSAFRKIGAKLISCNLRTKKTVDLLYYEGSLRYIPKLIECNSLAYHSVMFDYIDVKVNFCIYNRILSHIDGTLEYLTDLLENLEYITWKKSQRIFFLLPQMPSTTFRILDSEIDPFTHAKAYLRNEKIQQGFTNSLKFTIEKLDLVQHTQHFFKDVIADFNSIFFY